MSHGLEHLAHSNIDWGQGFDCPAPYRLRSMSPDQKIRLAYFGIMYPEVLGIDYELPPLDGPALACRPSQALNVPAGDPFPAPNAGGGQSNVPLNSRPGLLPAIRPDCRPRVLDLRLRPER